MIQLQAEKHNLRFESTKSHYFLNKVLKLMCTDS